MKKKLTPIAIDKALELSEILINAIADLKRPLQRKTDTISGDGNLCAFKMDRK